MPDEYWKRSAAELTAMVRSKQASAVEIVEDAMARLAAVNPAINAVVDETPNDAFEAARAVDAAIARGEAVGPLAGVPVTVKVNVDQSGYANTNGLRLQKDLIAKSDSPVVSNLKKAGAAIIGRTNTPAFSLRWFCRNSLHGHTKNPRDPKLTPGGSSGGAAAAVAAGIGAIGHGTDIGGSIRYPAYACGVHGLRPSLGRVAAANFTALDRYIGPQLMAVSGPIARTVADLRLGLEAMSAFDPRDPWNTPTPTPATLGPAQKRAALTVAPEGLVVDPAVEAALRDGAKRLEDAGWEVVETDCPSFRKPARLQAILWMADYRMGAEAAVKREADPDAAFILEQMYALSPPVDLEALMTCFQERMALMREWRLFLADYPLLICPVSAEPPFPDLLDIESPDAFRRCMEAQLTQVGLPAMSLPGLAVTTGMHGTAPVGVQLVADSFREDVLLDAAETIEAAGVPASPVDPAPA